MIIFLIALQGSSVAFLTEAFVNKMHRNFNHSLEKQGIQVDKHKHRGHFENSKKEGAFWFWRREADTGDDLIGFSFSIVCDFITDSTQQLLAQKKINYRVNILVF